MGNRVYSLTPYTQSTTYTITATMTSTTTNTTATIFQIVYPTMTLATEIEWK